MIQKLFQNQKCTFYQQTQQQMDIFLSHLPELQALGMLALGLFCYNRLKKSNQGPIQSPTTDEINQQKLESPIKTHRQEDKDSPAATVDQHDDLKRKQTCEECQGDADGGHGGQGKEKVKVKVKGVKRKVIRKRANRYRRSVRPNRPIFRKRVTVSIGEHELIKTEVMIE